MKTLKKQNKKAIIISAVLLSVIMAGLIAIVALMIYAKYKPAENSGSSGSSITLLEGESSYLGTPMAYPRVSESQIMYINVENEYGIFDLTRWPDENGSFWLGYGEPGTDVMEMVQYMPPITGAEGDFDYESLYAIENNDGYGRIYLLTYLCSAIGGPYFSERIALPEDTEENAEERANVLEEYGFKSEKTTRVTFTAAVTDKGGKIVGEKAYTVYIGGRALTESGFYYMVAEQKDVLDKNGNPVYYIEYGEDGFPKRDEEGNYIYKQETGYDGEPLFDSDGNPVYKKQTEMVTRNHIYYTNVNYFEYALKGFNAFVKGTLVSAGLAEDSTYEPYLTTDYKQWLLNEYEKDGDVVVDGSTVLCLGDFYGYISKGSSYDTYRGEDTMLSFDLESLKEHPDYERIRATLVGKTVGVYYDPEKFDKDAATKIYLTMITELQSSYGRLVEFGDAESVSYTYRITKIESVIGDDFESIAAETKVSDGKYVKVAYAVSADGGSSYSGNHLAVVDLSDPALPESAREQLLSATVGYLDTPIDFDLEYTRENSLVCDEKLVISDIMSIYDSKGALSKVIAADSYVTVRYYEVVNGRKTDYGKLTVSMADLAKDGGKWKYMYDALIGKEAAQDITLTVYSDVYYYEIFREFITYAISDIDSYITSEYVVAFRFANPDDRDPFYGESYYTNTLPEGHKHSLYGLNASSCEGVVALLGGVGTSGTVTSAGFAGECVAVGLTPENMDKYGLYAHKIYFELPRGIYEKDTTADDENALAEWGWYDTLGFTLYVSDLQDDGSRYVGSDMYDLIAKVDGELLYFLDYSFSEFWARMNPVLIDVSNLTGLKIEFEMDDLYGSYNFDVDHREWYITSEGATQNPESGGQKFDRLVIMASTSGECTETVFSEYAAADADGLVNVTNFYDELLGTKGKLESNGDTVGVGNFKVAFQILQLTRYQGLLTEEEQAEGLANAPRVLRLYLRLSNDENKYYTYDFYRIDDRRVMISMYITDDGGNRISEVVSDFYISHFAFRKLVNGFVSFLNAEIIDLNVGYPDEESK